MNVKSLLIAAMVTMTAVATPMAAFGADVPLPLARPEVFTSQVVNFDGPYAGLGVIYSDKEYVPVASVGYDLRYDALLFGVEAFGTLEESPTVGVDVKAGVVLTDDFAVYGIAGVQQNTGTDVNSNSFGVGADLAITETIYVTGSYKQVYDIGTFDNRDDQFRVGVKFAF